MILKNVLENLKEDSFISVEHLDEVVYNGKVKDYVFLDNCYVEEVYFSKHGVLIILK